MKNDEANHKWDAGKVTEKATEKQAGVRTYTCTVCKATKTSTIPKLKPSTPKVSGTPLAKMAAGKTSLTIGWNKIQGADGYDIFFAKCKKKTACKKIKTIKGNKTFKWTKPGLKKGTSYKAHVKAYVMKNGKKSYVNTSPMIHAYAGNIKGKYTNARSVILKNVKKGKLSLKKGKTFKIKAKVTKVKKNKKLMPGKHVKTVRYMTSNKNVATVSKSGKIAWLSMEHDGYEADKNRIFMMDANGGNKVDLSANWDYSVDALFWSPDEKYLYFICPFQGTMPIFRMEVATQKIDTIAAGQYDYDGLAFAGDQFVTLRHSYLEPNEVFAFKAGEEPKQLSHVNDELLGQLAKVECRKVMVPTTDGKQMTTWVLLPPGFDESKKYPAILFCEGGPQSPVSQFWSYRWNLRIMANHGYVVIAPNRRGLPGFGTEWNAQISGDYGGQNMKDYMSAVDYMKKEPWIDGEHIGATGASYGGFSVYWLAGNHQKRFAAFLAHAGIFNLMGQYLETEELWFVNWDLGGPYWDKSNAVAQKSYSVGNPANYVQNWDTPIMCTTGDNDFRIVYTQTMQAFNAAKLRGLPARMVLFPDEDHWCQKPQNSVLWQREFFKWFDSWLMPESEAFKARVAAEAGEAQPADSTATK